MATTNTVPKRGQGVSNGIQSQSIPLNARSGASRSALEARSKTPDYFDKYIDGTPLPDSRKSALDTKQYHTLEADPDTSEDPLLLVASGTIPGSPSSSDRRGSAQSSKSRPAVEDDSGKLVSRSSQFGGRASTPSKRPASRAPDDQAQRKKPRPSPPVLGELSEDPILPPGPALKGVRRIDFTSSKKEKMKPRKVRLSY